MFFLTCKRESQVILLNPVRMIVLLYYGPCIKVKKEVIVGAPCSQSYFQNSAYCLKGVTEMNASQHC